MFLFKKANALHLYIRQLHQQHFPVAFIPTMGALHAGHLALIQLAAKDGYHTVCSIFVNPTQFNDPRDLEKYPRTPEKDIELLVSVGCTVLFLPTVAEVYPSDLEQPTFEFDYLEKILEGAFRPGHFRGVAQVVSRLLDLVQPDALYMGQKDYQQVAIIQSMLQQLHSTVKLVMAPTLREADGLAMSSRNVRLTPDFRRIAPVIFQTLVHAKQQFQQGYAPAEIQQYALQKLITAGLKPEYFELVDGKTLLPIERFNDSKSVVACTAAWAGEVRLIDNLLLKS